MPSLKIVTHEMKDFDQFKERFFKTYGRYSTTTLRWRATIDGPWYDDSNPEGRGDTEEEAVKNAINALREMYNDIGEFLKDYPNA